MWVVNPLYKVRAKHPSEPGSEPDFLGTHCTRSEPDCLGTWGSWGCTDNSTNDLNVSEFFPPRSVASTYPHKIFFFFLSMRYLSCICWTRHWQTFSVNSKQKILLGFRGNRSSLQLCKISCGHYERAWLCSNQFLFTKRGDEWNWANRP